MSALEIALRLGAWLICTFFVLALAALIHRQLPLGRPALSAVSLILLVIFLTTLFVFLAGLLGLLRADSLAVIGFGGLVLMAAIPPWRKSLQQIPHDLSASVTDLRRFWSSLPRWLRFFSVAAVLASLLRFAFLIWALPPFVWDSLTYHLTNVAHWTQVGRIELFDTPILRIYTPANYEVLATWFTVFLHHDAFVETAGLPAYLLALVAVYACARSLGCSRPASWMGAMAYASTPALLLATTGTKNDPHIAAYYLASLALVLDLAGKRPPVHPRQSLSSLVLLSITLLLAAGTKAYIAHLLPGLALTALLIPGMRRALPHWRARLAEAAQGWRSLAASTRLSLLLLLLGAVLLGGYWNVRNWALTGNPFYPYGVTIEGARIFTGGERTARLNLARLAENLESLADKFGDAAGPIEPDLPETTGWGWFFYGLGLPAALWVGLTRRSFLPSVLGFLLSLLVLMLSIRPSPFNMRYLLWFPAVASLAYACWLDDLPSRPRVLPIVALVAFSVALALNLAMSLNYSRVSLDRFGLVLERPLWERQAALLKLNMPSEYEHAILFAPASEPLGYNVGSNGFIYPLYRADLSQRLVYVPVSESDDCPSIAARMRERGTRYLFVAEGHTPGQIISRVRVCAQDGGSLAEQSRGLYVINAGS
jgi:hypothetical protein